MELDLPKELEFRYVKKQTPVIINKESRQILPQNGTSFTQGSSGQTQIVFRIPNDENVSWDLSTMWITAELQIGGLTTAQFTTNACNAFDGVNGTPANVAATLSVADSIESCIQRVHILVNGSELERHDYYNVQETMLNAHTNNSNFSNSIGAGCMLMNLSHVDKHKLLLGGAAAGGRTSSNILQVSFPLRWLGIANLRSLVPTYMLGGGQSAIEIRLFLASALDYITAGVFTVTNETPLTLTALSAANANALTYTLSSVRMNVDCVHTSDAYSTGLREYLASNQLQLPIDTYYSTVYNFQATDNGWVNFTISTQFSDISAVYLAFFRSAEQNNTLYSGIDRMFRPPNINEARLLINGKPYPAVPIKFGTSGLEAEAYQYLMKSLKQNCSLEVIGNANASMVNTNNFSGYGTTGALAIASGTVKNLSTYSGSGLYYGQNKVAPLTTAVSTADNILTKEEYFAKTPSTFMLGWSVAKSDYSDEFELSGADLSRSSGLIQLNINFSQAIGEAYQAVVLIKHKRILDIGLDSSQVIY